MRNWQKSYIFFAVDMPIVYFSLRNNLDPRRRLQTYFGYAFESYCTSLYPAQQEETDAEVPGWSGDVDTNIQWCSVVKTKLGDTRMVIGGEVDCIKGKYRSKVSSI
jgi:RAT1-interacting protein